MAIAIAGAPTRLVFASDVQRHLRDFIRDNFQPSSVFRSAGVVSTLKPFTDVYVAGPPCVRFSILGGRQGEPDAETSTLEMAVRHIELRRPTAFVLENVMGMLTIDGGRVFRTLVARLGVAGHYSVTFGVLNSRDFGVAQSRRRIYIVGVC